MEEFKWLDHVEEMVNEMEISKQENKNLRNRKKDLHEWKDNESCVINPNETIFIIEV